MLVYGCAPLFHNVTFSFVLFYFGCHLAKCFERLNYQNLSVRLSVCLSVCYIRDLYQNGAS